MGNKLYVGNLPYSYRDSDMEQAFSQYGTVSSAKVMMERDTGRSKGFGFVEMSSRGGSQGRHRRHERPADRRPWPRGQRSPSDGVASPGTGGFGGGGGGGYGGGGGGGGGGRCGGGGYGGGGGRDRY